ncbi:MAG: three-Cys-motif partner protein TcmP [Planctomycetota bacterium]|jgi:three-Cys-motif partner protein
MSAAEPTIWEGSAHTFAKHKILETYLSAWMPIMSRQALRLGMSETELLFVDGFAGPGIYKGGQPGSPILAIKLVLEHSYEFHGSVRFLFIEQKPERYAKLKEVVSQFEEQSSESTRIKSITVQQGDCQSLLNKYLDHFDTIGKKLGPAFFFLDQFGYSDVSMQLINRIMKHSQCEVFSYLNWSRMNQFISDHTKWSAISTAFGNNQWKKVLELPTNKRALFILNTYRNALRANAHAKYVWHFAMADKDAKLLYWLFFCTNSLRGLEEMKKAMWRVDPTGGFRFSDKDDPSQLNLFQACTDEILAHELSSSLKGQTLTVSQIKEFVLTQTPACSYKTALKFLEIKEKLIEVKNAPANRRRGTFPDETLQVKFLYNRSV